MAIVRTIQCENGGTVMIADDCYRGLSAEELERRHAEISRVILRIDRKYQANKLQNTEEGASHE